jgi:hypothetical protein
MLAPSTRGLPVNFAREIRRGARLSDTYSVD